MSTSTTALPTSALAANHVPAVAAPARLPIFVRETRFEFLRLLRARAFSLSVIGFPVMFYVLFGLVMNRGNSVGSVSVARYLVAGYAVFGAVGAALFGVGVQLSAELHAGWLELKRSSPMPPAAYLTSKVLTAVSFGVLIVLLLMGLARGFAGVTFTPVDTARMLLLTAVAAVPFSLLGILIALLVPPNSAPGVTNLVYLPLSFLGGLWVPIGQLPTALQHFAVALPTFHLGQLMIGVLGGHARGTVAEHAVYLLGFTALCAGLVRVLFYRREVAA